MAEPYTSWSLRLQLITLFIVYSLIIAVLFICLTVVLIWVLQFKTLQVIQQLQQEYKQQEIKMLLEQHSDQQYYFHSSVIQQTRKVCGYFQKVYQQDLLQYQTPNWTNQLQVEKLEQQYGRYVSFDYGAFFSDFRDTHTDKIEEKINKTTQMNKISKNLYGSGSYLNIYNSLTDGDLLYMYPAAYFDPEGTQSILVQDWYNSPINSPDEVYLTEPYLSSISGNYQIGGSKTFKVDGEQLGVAGIDLLLDWLTEQFKDRDIGGRGFELIVSQNGIVLAHPQEWNQKYEITIVFDQPKTGISQEVWDKIQEKHYDGEKIEFEYIDGKTYLMWKKVIELPDKNKLYLLINQKQSYYSQEKRKVEQSFSELQIEIFVIVVFVAVTVYILVILLIIWTTHILVKNLRTFNSLLNQILMDSHNQYICQNIWDKLKYYARSSSWISQLYEAFQYKIEYINKIESQFQHYDWGDYKPNNVLLFDNWRLLNRPFNRIYDSNLKWSKELMEKVKKKPQTIN